MTHPSPQMSAAEPIPFFTSPGLPAGRRILLVSVAYPPNAEVGSLRWQKIAQEAYGRGWTVDVILIDPTDASIREPARLNDVPPGARLFDVPLLEISAQRAERAARRLAGALVSGARGADSADASSDSGSASGALASANAISTRDEGQGRAARPGVVGNVLRAYRARMHFAQWNDWSARAAAVGTALARSTHYDVIASSGPPHFAHDAARQVSEATGRPLVIDLRDPWFSDDVEPMALRGKTWRTLTASSEARAVEQAALVVVNTDSCRLLMSERYPAMRERFLTVMNGADPDVSPATSVATEFVISHAGSLYSGRDPGILFRAVAKVVARLSLLPGALRVHFMGDDVYEGRPLHDLAEAAGVGAFTVVESRRPRAEALALIRASAMVVLLPQQHVHSIPGKVFEYVQLAAWPLVIADRGSATEVLLRDSGADVLSPDDLDGVAGAIESRYIAFRRGERPTPLNSDGRFNRDKQNARLFDALDSLA